MTNLLKNMQKMKLMLCIFMWDFKLQFTIKLLNKKVYI